MTSSPERFLTPKQVGRLLQMDASTVLRWVHGGLLPAYRTPGGHRRINPGELLAFLRAHQMYVPPELEQRRKLLLVHDDVRALEMLSRAFAASGAALEVHASADALEALLQFGELRPDVVIFAGRPSVDPLEVARRLKLNPKSASVQVVLASDDRSLEPRAREVGAVLVPSSDAQTIVDAVLERGSELVMKRA